MKSKKQKKADAAFIKKIGTISVKTSKAELHKFAEAHGIPTTVEHEGEKFTLKSATQVNVEIHCECKHDDSGEMAVVE